MISSATVLVFAAFAIAVVTFLVMMIALYVGLINQLSFDKGFYGVVAVALCAGIKIYACFRKRDSCSASDASANKGAHAVAFQKS